MILVPFRPPAHLLSGSIMKSSTTPSAAPPEPCDSTTPTLGCALLLSALRTLVRSWRERAAALPPEQAEIYARAEQDLAAVIEAHADRLATWESARDDLVAALVRALDERAAV